MEKNLNQMIDSLQYRLESLFEVHQKLQEDYLKLKDTLNDYKHLNGDLENQLSDLNQKYKVLKNVNALLGSEDYKRETKLKINTLVKEIDQCIAQLS